jgi:hypothetical protein
MTVDTILFISLVLTVIGIVVWDMYQDEKIRNQTYDIGSRVFGRWNEIPFIGTVGSDSSIDYTDDSGITIHLDLPIKVDKEFKSTIVVKHTDIKQLLKEY